MGTGFAAPAISANAVKAGAAKSHAPKTASPAAHAPAAQAAVKKYQGAYSGALNNLSEQQQRVRDVEARRQRDADQYAAFVMGAQGNIAAAAQRADQQNLAQTVAVQGNTLGRQLMLQKGLQSQRAAAGGDGLVPNQQFSGLVDDQQRTQALLGAVSQQASDTANTNRGKAGFLQAAAQAGLMANKRAIAGDAFNQESEIANQKTGILTQRTESIKNDKRAAAQAEATAAAAAQDHADRMASLENAAAIAQGSQNTQRDIAGARIASAEKQGGLNRRVRLKTAATTAAAGGYATPAEHRRRNTALKSIDTSIDQGKQRAAQLSGAAAKTGIVLTPALLRHALLKDNPKMSTEEQDYVLAATFGHKAGVSKKGGPTAAARLQALKNKIQRGEL